ncbi:MAG: DUF3801 domain-containing protein [Angelakisella sp.]
MAELQEDAAQGVLRFMFKVPQLTGKLIIAALEEAIRRMEAKEPIGLQRMETLMRGGNKMEKINLGSSLEKLDTDLKAFEQIAREYGIGFSAYKMGGQPGYQVFFRAKNVEQMKTCMEEFTRYRMVRDYKMSEIPAEPEHEVYKGEILDDRAIVPGKGIPTKKHSRIVIETELAVRAGKKSMEQTVRQARQQAKEYNQSREKTAPEHGREQHKIRERDR